MKLITPRKKQFESDAEKQKAYRERKKGLKQKLSNLINGNHKNTTSNLSPSENIEQPKKIVKVIMDTESNRSSDNQGKSVLKQRVLTNCVWCGKNCVGSEMKDGKCPFCSQFQSIEEMRFMSKVSSKLSILPRDVQHKRKQFWYEALENYRKQHSRGELNE